MRCEEIFLDITAIEERIEKLKKACLTYDYNTILGIINDSELHYHPKDTIIDDPLFKFNHITKKTNTER